MPWSWEWVVEILEKRGSEEIPLGSGALVAPNRILTAHHVIQALKTGELHVRLEGRTETVPVHEVKWTGSNDLDVALLEAPLGHDKLGSALAIFSDREIAAQTSWEAKGFPEVSAKNPRRDALKYGDVMRSWVAAEEFLILRETAAPDSWSGLSGAAIVVHGQIVGVMRSFERHHDNQRLRATPVARFLHDPAFRNALGITAQDEVLDKRIQSAVDNLAKWLISQDELLGRLARKLDVAYAPGQGAPVLASTLLRERQAALVVQQLNYLDADLVQENAPSSLRAALRTLLWQVLPLASDWRQLVRMGLASFSRSRNAVDLPLRSETIAEIILAGIDDRYCNFAPVTSQELPIGATVVRIPTLAKSALLDRDGSRLAQLIVKELATVVNMKTHEVPYEDLRTDVDALLEYHTLEAPPHERLPYYLLFVADELRGTNPEQDLWTISREAVGSALPCLRLVRLTGSANKEHTKLAKHIDAICRRK